jgi:hypothetical protein
VTGEPAILLIARNTLQHHHVQTKLTGESNYPLAAAVHPVQWSDYARVI